jgi:predicted GTPase
MSQPRSAMIVLARRSFLSTGPDFDAAQADVQLTTIERGISSLVDLASDPVAQEALDISHSVDVARSLDLLKRLRHSLRQYIERGQDLCYVALIGHFSAGKSSTINSVLSLWNTQNQRRVDLNPTDTAITLITSAENEGSLLGVVREGIVPIRTRSIESDVLSKLVIADTPGTGDPDEVQEIARQFLPICDLVLFLFPATSPFDITDIPLLAELRRRLPFIPIKFILTRADEFRVDRYAPVNETNLEKGKLVSFLSDIIARINKSTQLGLTIEPSDFFVIDNVEQFGISELRRFLALQGQEAAVHTRIRMHGHKVQFFRDSANECHAILRQRLTTQFEDIDKIVRTAKRNVERFQECITPANATITKRWLEELQRITVSRTSEAAGTQSLQLLPNRIADLPMSYQSQLRFSQTAQADANARAGRVAAHATASSTNQLNILVLSIQRASSVLDIRKAEAFLQQLEQFPPVSVTLDDLELWPGALDNWIQDAVRGCLANLRSAEQTTTESCNRLERAIALGTLLKSAQDAIGVAAEVLSLELDKYFEIVLIYHGSVFARHVKEAISRAGLGKQLDDLEHEMSEDQRQTTKNAARQDLLGALEQKLSET